MALSRGDTLDGRYLLLERLGVGGQGAVWKVRDALGQKGTWAMKLIDSAGLSSAAVQRARREALVLNRLRHPSLVGCHRVFEDQERRLMGLVLDLAEGRTLAKAIDQELLGHGLMGPALIHVVAALAYLHEHGIVHRDVKPANIILTDAFFDRPHDASTVKVVDLGIASRAGNPSPLTSTGRMVGTLRYMAPEQLEPAHWKANPAAMAVDVFSFGVVAYEALAGAHPTGSDDDATAGTLCVAYRHHAGQHVGPLDIIPDLRWRAVLERCLMVDASQRLLDCRELFMAITGVQRRLQKGHVTETADAPRAEAPLEPAASGGRWLATLGAVLRIGCLLTILIVLAALAVLYFVPGAPGR